MINLRILSGELLNQGESDRAERCVVSVFLFGVICGVFCDKVLRLYNCGLGFIFYWYSVVGEVVNCLNLIYGGGIHRTRRYRCVHKRIQV